MLPTGAGEPRVSRDGPGSSGGSADTSRGDVEIWQHRAGGCTP